MKLEIVTIILGAMPVLEIRGAITLAVFEFGFSLPKAFFLGALGNALPVVPTLFVLRKFAEFMMRRWYFFNRLMVWLFERFQKRHRGHFDGRKWRFAALFVFVALPLPFTGMWSGIIASYVLGIPFWKSVSAICLGIIASGLIVSAILFAGISGVKVIF